MRPSRSNEANAQLHIREGGNKLQEDLQKRTDGSIICTNTRGIKSEKKETKSKGESQCFRCRKQDHWVASCTDLEEDKHGQLHACGGFEKYDKDK